MKIAKIIILFVMSVFAAFGAICAYVLGVIIKDSLG